MTAIEQLLVVSRAYRQATGLRVTTLSWRLFGDSKKLRAIENGADIHVTRYERALRHLSDMWPSGLSWPDGVPRPPQSEVPIAPEQSGAAA